MCCNKEYPKLFCPGKNQRAIDYINDWIDSANVVLQAYGTDLLELQAWREEVEKNGAIDQLPILIAEVNLLKTYTIDDHTIDLAKVAAITQLFIFDEEYNILQANINPGNYPDEIPTPPATIIPVEVNGVLYTRGDDYRFYEADIYGNADMEKPAPIDLVEEIIIAWEGANPDAPEPGDDPEEPEEPETFDENVSLAITIGEDHFLRGGIAFTGEKDVYLSGAGTWEKMSELPNFGVIETTWKELLETIEKKELVPGNWYRITDYHTIILSSKASCVNTRVDIFMLALDAQTLDENVLFLQNSTDTYLIDSNVKAWRGKYCVTNDVTRFDFINAFKTYIVLNSGVAYVRYEDADVKVGDVQYYGWKPLKKSVYGTKAAIEPYIAVQAEIPAAAIDYADGAIVFTTAEIPEISVDGPDYGYGYYEYPYGYTGVRDSSTIYDGDKNPIPATSIEAVYPVSMGAIYHLEDEFGNSVPYDFKSILFTWKEDNVSGFTFSKFLGNNFYDAADASVMNTELVYRNIIDELYESFEDSQGQSYQRLSLNKILHASPCMDNFYGVNMSDTYTLGECRNNRWSGNSGGNKFKKAVIGNYFYPEFNNNLFEVAVKGNMLMENFHANTFTLPSHDYAQFVGGVVPEFEFSHNTIGTNFRNNTITMPRIIGNVIGKDASENILKGTVAAWSTAGHTYQNTLYTEDKLNFVGCSIKNNFHKNTVTGCLYSTTIGNNFVNNEVSKFINCNLADQIQENLFKSTFEELILGGNNMGMILDCAGSFKNTTIEYGCSYLKCYASMLNAHIHRGVTGTKSGNTISYKDLTSIATGAFTDYVTDYVTNKNREQIVV